MKHSFLKISLFQQNLAQFKICRFIKNLVILIKIEFFLLNVEILTIFSNESEKKVVLTLKKLLLLLLKK